MLPPSYIKSLPDAMVQLYALVEADILADMARRIKEYDYWIPAAQHQAMKLKEMGMVREEILQQLSALTGKSQKELTQLMADAGAKTIKAEDETYKAAGMNPPPLATSRALQKTLNAGLKRTNGSFKNLTKTTAKTASKQFEDALDRAWLQITSGAFDYNTAVRMAIKDLSRAGVGAIKYPSGHIDNLEVAVRRATITGVNQTQGELVEARREEMHCNLVEVSAHSGARPDHAAWQGGIYWTIEPDPDFPQNFYETCGYGSGSGIYGWNCSHSHRGYIKGMPRAYSQDQLKQYDEKSYTYNGHKMTEYEANQQQRYIERQIRRWKRENVAMKAAGQDTTESALKIAHWQSTQKDFLKQTGLKRQIDREQIGQRVRVGKGQKSGGASAVRGGIIKESGVSAAKNFEELKKYLVSDFGITEIDSVIRTLDFNGIKETVIQMERVFQKFPQLKGFVSKIYPRDAGMMSAGPVGIPIESVKISFNPKYYTDYNALLKSFQAGVDVGFHPNGTAAISGVHELGHAAEAYLVKQRYSMWSQIGAWNECRVAKEIISEACKAAKKLPAGKGLKNADLIRGISRYAESSRSECLAEAFADCFANGENAAILSKEIMRIVEREMMK